MDTEVIKSVLGLLVRWSLKFVGGWLTISGISESAYVEVAIGVLMALVGVAVSLFQRKKDLNAPAPGQ